MSCSTKYPEADLRYIGLSYSEHRDYISTFTPEIASDYCEAMLSYWFILRV